MDKIISNEEISGVPFLDTLTGLYDRNAFFIVAQHQLKIALRTKRWLSLLLVDITIDQTIERLQKDRIVADTAALLNKTFRSSDIIARFGENEFAILAIEASYNSSHLLKARLRKHFEEFYTREKTACKPSLNIGMEFFDPDHPCSLMNLLARAVATML